MAVTSQQAYRLGMGQAHHEDDTDLRAKSDAPLSDRRPPWRRSPRRCDSTTTTALLEYGMVWLL